MYVVPEALRSRGAIVLVEPSALDAVGYDANSAFVGVAATGDIVLHVAGGLFSSGRTDVVPAAALKVGAEGVYTTVSGGVIRLARFELDKRSTVARILDAVAHGVAPVVAQDGWTAVDTVEASELAVDPVDPRQAPKVRIIGRQRSTAWLWRGSDGALIVDDPHEVVVLDAADIRAIERAGNDPLAAVIHAIRPLRTGGLLAGIRIRAAKPVLEPRGTPPLAVAQASVRGHLEGQAIAGRVMVRTEADIEVFEAGGAAVGAIAAKDARWRADGDTLLVRGPGEQFAVTIAEDLSRWLMRGIPEHPVPLYEILSGPVPAGAGELRLVDGRLVVHTASEATIDLGAIDEPAVRAETTASHTTLTIGEALSLRGTAKAVADLRALIGPALGRQRLDGADVPELYRRYHELRTERWLWLVFGPIFVTARQLEAAGRLPRELDEDDEHLSRRRVVAETLIVAEQLRAFRLRFGAAAAALPYAMLDEEAAWLTALGSDTAELGRHRPRIVNGLRQQIRVAAAQLSFAQLDIERAVARLEPVHYPELRGQPPTMFGTSLLGKIGIGTAVMLLNPISGAVQIMSAVAGTVTDRLSKDSTSRVLLDRFGPYCRTSWDLLVDVTGLTAAETRAWLHALWTDLALRDKQLIDAAPERSDRVRAALVARIGELQRDRQRPVEIEGETIADVMTKLNAAMEAGADKLTNGLGA